MSILPVVGMFALTSLFVGIVVIGADHENKQQLPVTLEKLEQAKLIEIKDSGGQIVLRGNFEFITEKDGDVDGVATLAATSIDADASGHVELEVSKKNDGAVIKEFEIEMRKLDPAATYTLLVDGLEITTLRTNARGSVEMEMSNRPVK